MSFFGKIKSTFSKKKKSKKGEMKASEAGGDVHILPVPGPGHPAPPETGGGLNSDPQHPKGPGPVILSPEQAAGLGEPATREELHARAEALNAGS